MSQRTRESASPAQTKKIAKELVLQLSSGRGSKNAATVVGLKGELGAGKTTFIQGMGRALGVKERIVSPTFVVMRVFRLSRRSPFRHFAHIDCWRLAKPRELAELGFNDLIRDRNALVVVEWAEKVKKLLPRGTTWVEIRGVSSKKRVLTISHQP